MGIKVTVKLYAMLGQYLPAGAQDNQLEIEVAEGTTPAALFGRLNLPSEHCHLVLVNGVYLEPSQRGEHALHDRDTLAVWPPIAGG
jgi:molybdopterin synthase sulfur carrier subunit